MSTRDRILDAAAHVMRSRGLARSTTKEIAKAAGYSEATLYKHFQDKTDLFLAVLAERVPSDLGSLLADPPARAGHDTVRDTLERVAIAAIDFYQQSFPIAASLFSEPALLAAHRAALHERGTGPHHVSRAVAAYLAEEKRLGRVSADCDPGSAAALLLGACLQHAFLGHFVLADQEPPDRVAAALVGTLLNGIVG